MTDCRKCKREVPEGALFCPWCGISQTPTKRKGRTRPNGTGTAFKRGDTWTARVVVGWKRGEGGKALPVYRSKGGFKAKRDALQYCDTLRQDQPKKAAPKLVEYWETYRDGEYAQLGKSKRMAYDIAWRKLAPLHWRPVDQITVAELRSTCAQVAHTYYTVRDCKSLLTRLFLLASADGWCSKDLPSYIVLPKLEEKERQAFDESEQRALWALYESGDLRAAIPLLMICTGMMPGEMQALRVEHVHLADHKILGVGMKTKVRRQSPIYLPDDVLPMVEDLLAHAQPSGYVWPRDAKKWYASYYAALEAAGCRRLEPYCCRHTTATRLAITENIAPQTIKRMMRWSTSKMLDRYAHPDDEAVFSAANTFTNGINDGISRT